MPSNSMGYPVVREAVFYGQRAEATSPAAITVFQQENNHDVVSLVSYLDDNTPNRYRAGVPVSVSWGALNRRVTTFQGYVHHTEPMVSPTGAKAYRNVVKIVCVGATYLMKNKHRRSWEQRTVPSVLAEIFDGYKMSLQTEQHNKIWDVLVQSGESDWEFVCGLAHRIGWAIYPDNTDVMAQNRRVDLRAAKNTTSVFIAAPPTSPTGGLNSILTFQAIDGETTPDGGQKANRISEGIDPWQGTYFTAAEGTSQPVLGWVSPDALFTEYSTDVARSYGEAATRLAGEAEDHRLYIQAKAEVVGDAYVRPGRAVSLGGLGAKSNGLWYVQAVEHEVDQGTYVMHLTLGRDARWDTGFRPNAQRRRVVQPRTDAYGTPLAVTPPTVLVAGVWRAAYSTVPA